MMRLLLILTVAFTASAFADGEFALVGSDGRLPSAFKHSLHADMECIACHTGVEKSNAGTDNLLPLWSACADCHSPEDVANKGVALGEQKEGFIFKYVGDYSPVFRHQRHIEKAGLECNTCHANLDEPVSHFPKMADCMECHTNRSVNRECKTCHLPGEKLTPADHDIMWAQRHGIAASADDAQCMMCHISGTKLDCQSCHQGDAVINPHPRNYLNSHGQDAHLSDFRCGTCHEQRSFCIDCHRDMNVLPADHFRPGFVTPNGGTHGEAAEFDLESCMSCHDTPNVEPTCARCHAQ